MAFVLDASIAAVWAFDDEDHEAAVMARQALIDDPAFAPSLWWFELRNTLLVNERRKRITEIQVTRFLHTLASLPIQLDFDPNERDVLSLARRHRLTVYDASYLELSLRLALPVATLDGELIAAARSEHIKLIGSP